MITGALVNTQHITDFFCVKVAGRNNAWNCVIVLTNGREYATSLTDVEKTEFYYRLRTESWISLDDNWFLCIDDDSSNYEDNLGA